MDLAKHVERKEFTVSHQLRYLRAAGLVDDRKDGQKVYYTLNDKRVGKFFKLALED